MQGQGGARDDGFSVLEAMIAVFLLAAAFLPLLELQGRFVTTTESLERAEARIIERQIAESHLATVNFALQPQGRTRIGRVTVGWRATPLAPARPVKATGGAPSRFMVSLYEVEVEAFTFRDAFTTPMPERADVLPESVGGGVRPHSGDAGLPRLRYNRRGLGWTATQSAIESL